MAPAKLAPIQEKEAWASLKSFFFEMTLSMTGDWEWPKRRQLGDRVGEEAMAKNLTGLFQSLNVCILETIIWMPKTHTSYDHE